MVKHIFMKKGLFILLLLGGKLFAQPYTLDKVNELAKQNYPLIKQQDLINRTRDITVENLQKNFLPQFALSGQASYQSEVTKISVPVPGITIPSPSKDQYKILADVSQLVYDGGAVKQQKEIQQLNATVEQQKIEVELYKLQERINQLYLSVLYIDEQVAQVDLIKKDLENGMKKVEAQVKNGVSFKSNLNVLKAEWLKADQRTIELAATRKGLLETIGLFINQSIDTAAVFEKPVLPLTKMAFDIRRPELQLFSAQQKLFNGQNKLIESKNLPKASLFFQGGYGRPGLNFLKNDFDFFYTTGVRFNWSFGGLYTSKKEKELVRINNQIVDVQKDLFLLNTNTQLRQQQAEIDKIEQLIARDEEIIELRVSVKQAANAQLENGVITANDYLREVNAEDQARQTRITHELQLLQAKINYLTTSGNK
ncbi:MAG: TolC family protein [Sphingobacteriales bacterium]|nr:MAG: TolC family protein [Sphingobacteriales bacterium]